MLPDNYVLELPAILQMEYQNYNKVVLDLIDKLDLKERVIYPDKKVIGKEMFEYYKRADVVLIPSYFEGFGIVAVEAMNASSPVVTTCAGGLGEIIEDNYNGVKISLNDLSDAKEKIIKLREERKLTIETISSSLNISEYDLTSFEEGTLEPTLDQLRLLANFYDITIESLIDDNSDKLLLKPFIEELTKTYVLNIILHLPHT